MTKSNRNDAPGKFTTPKKETLMDKTTRVAQELIDDEAKQRQAKTKRLREARLKSDAATPDKPDKPDAKTST